jgi:L-asparagine transporter-like permease
MIIGFIALFCILQWLSIWAAIARIDKRNKDKRNKLFHKLICTLGAPALLGFFICIAIYFTQIPNWVSFVIYIVLDIIGLFAGTQIAKKVFKKDYEKQNNKKKKN